MATKTKAPQFTITEATVLDRTVYVVLDGDKPVFATFWQGKATKRAARLNDPNLLVEASDKIG